MKDVKICYNWWFFNLFSCMLSQNKGKSVATEELSKAHARAGELEEQVEKLKGDIELKVKDKNILEARVAEAEKKASELNSKFDSVSRLSVQLFQLIYEVVALVSLHTSSLVSDVIRSVFHVLNRIAYAL